MFREDLHFLLICRKVKNVKKLNECCCALRSFSLTRFVSTYSVRVIMNQYRVLILSPLSNNVDTLMGVVSFRMTMSSIKQDG